MRFLGNRSSGKQGHALAVAAAERGAHVTLVTSAPADLPGLDVVSIETALELRGAIHAAAAHADVVVMAAAVADFRPAAYTPEKIKKTHEARSDGTADDSAPPIALARNPTSSRARGATRGAARPSSSGSPPRPVTPTARPRPRPREARSKACDVLVVNEVGADKTFGSDDNTVTILRRGTDEDVESDGQQGSRVTAVWTSSRLL